jgi:NADH-quinone oxidoreductase subunit G
MRVLAREHDGVDDGWLCDKGRFAYQAMHVDERITVPLVREGGELRETSWERALEVAAGLAKHRGRVGALVGGQATNEEGFLIQRLVREGLSSSDIDSRGGSAVPAELTRALAAPALQATVPDLEFAHTVLVVGCDPLDDAPILDLRIRKGVRRRGVQLAVATARPNALDTAAQHVVRHEPGEDAEFLAGLASELEGQGGGALAKLLRDGGEEVVIVWGERLDPAALPSLLRITEALGLSGRDGAGLLEIPAGSNGRGLREAGVLAGAGPGYGELSGEPGRAAEEIVAAAAEGEVTALYLFETDPVRERPDRARWNQALRHASLVVAHASVLTDGLREHANVVFPADTYAEKDGTVVHPDGRLQRLRTAIAHPREVRAGWWVVADLARRCGLDTGVLTAPMAFAQLVEAVPFYEGLTLEAIGGRGVRWPEREEASAFPDLGDNSNIEAKIAQTSAPTDDVPKTPTGDLPKTPTDDVPKTGGSPDGGGALRLGTYRSIWASPEVEISPALQYTIARQQAELSPEDAARLGISSGEPIEVWQLDGSGAAQLDEAGGRVGGKPEVTRLSATAAVRSDIPPGTVFLATGIAAESANALTEPEVEVRKL